ncbi:MAG: discoidin domain-containing protein [Spirochaetes bacterium]|nr:discoidin domain-containing protein [Spirochaetota bacterium]
MYTDILKRKTYKAKLNSYSSQKDGTFSASSVLTSTSFWCSKPKDKRDSEFIVIELEETTLFNLIEIHAPANTANKNTFPQALTVLISENLEDWIVLSVDNDLYLEKNIYRLNTPLTRAKYLKFIVPYTSKADEGYCTQIGQISIGIDGVKAIKGSKSKSGNYSTNCLIDGNNDTYWETDSAENNEIYFLDIDLGEIFQLNYISMKSSALIPSGFPESFSITSSIDKKVWTNIIDQKNFKASSDEKYFWNINNINAKYLKIEMPGVSLDGGAAGIRISEISVFASTNDNSHSHVSSDNPSYATVFQPGVVRLAKDNECSRDAVIRSSDIRLKDASTIFKGIVQFAQDEESGEFLAVQASDSRLKNATETTKGIVRLAYDRETKENVAVQASDSRLKEASEKSFGIVKICMDGEYSEIGVVKGNDRRLKHATVNSPGIIRLAENGESAQNSAVQGNDKRLKDATTISKGIMQFAENGEISEFKAVQADDSRLRPATISTSGVVELADDGEDAPGKAVQGNDRRLKDATVNARGIVELAEDGEDKPNTAVQGNDRRLKKATTASEGILRIAEDGESAPMCAVQSNDSRLKPATTTSRGIVQLAENGENKPNVAVQGDDKRLKNATTMTRGIVELAEDGEDKSDVAVQGNDRRLKDATENSKGIMKFSVDMGTSPLTAVQASDARLKNATVESKGIMRFADNGEDIPETAVQGNDDRIKDATEFRKGISRLAQNGETSPLCAVQGNDKRLKDATTVSKGIVELAENGEDAEGVAVQGNDKRLRHADADNYGIMKFAADGVSKEFTAVQSSDRRLNDKREPLPHEHEYSPLDHSLNSHGGFLSLEGERALTVMGITPPVDDSALIYAKNNSSQPGSIGIAGIADGKQEQSTGNYGIFGHSGFIGVRGQSSGNTSGNEKGCGVLGISRFGAGGVFSSEHNYSLIVDGFGSIENIDESVKLIGDGKALLANGQSEFTGSVEIKGLKPADDSPINAVEMFESDNEEYISPGDILIVSPQGNSKLTRTQKEYDTRVCGIVSSQPALIFNNTDQEYQKLFPVALSGKVLCKVDARNNPVKPGDLIVTSSTPGCGMKGKIDSFEKIGSVVGKALESLDEGISTIYVFVQNS